MRTTGYTRNYGLIVNQLLIDCAVMKPQESTDGITQNLKALWDTGAQITCISQKVVDSLGLQPEGTTTITGAEDKPFKTDVYGVQLVMGNFVIPCLQVAKLPMVNQKHDMIIGMDVICKGDLSITNFNGNTCLTFREPSVEMIDYVSEITMFNKCLKIHNIKASHHIKNDLCACGSKKKYDNCHGKSKYNR